MDLVNNTKRNCNGCTACCEGWLDGKVKEHSFFPGTPCHYVSCGVGCTIYSERPEKPCRVYKCMWLEHDDFLPEWFKPNLSNIICDWRKTKNGIVFLNVVECGKTIGAKYLNWLFKEHLRRGFNLRYTLDGGFNYIGEPAFVAALNEDPYQSES